MCRSIIYKSSRTLTRSAPRYDCNHIWAEITHPCGPGMGFSTCPTFFLGDGIAKDEPPVYVLDGKDYRYGRRGRRGSPCPVCDLGGVYDRNRVRRIYKMRSGWRWGLGPGRDDLGVDFEVGGCCGVM